MSQVPFYSPYSFYPQARPASQTDSFLAYMQDGKIFRQTSEGPQQIGVVSKTFDDLQADYDSIYATCKEYYDALVKAGIITPELTQEEILKQQAEQIKQQAEQLSNASKVIAESAASQKELMNVVEDLRNELASLKQQSNESYKEKCLESYSNDTEQYSNVESVEGENKTGLGDNKRLSELPKRVDAGTGGSQHKHPAASKRSSLPSKRPSGRNTQYDKSGTSQPA